MERLMTFKKISIALAALAWLLGSHLASAASPATDKAAEAAERTPGAVKEVVPGKASGSSKTRVKRVDINGANKAALMELPGITDLQADKIIANRPYGSKTWLLSNNVIDAAAFYAIKSLIEARQPFKTAEENAAVYEKLKKNKAGQP
jgi:competence protein ComEA